MRIKLTPAIEFFEEANLVAQPSRLLKFQLLGGLLHFAGQLGEQPRLAAFEKANQAVNVFAVLLLADSQIAGRGALLDAGQKARPKPPPALVTVVDIETAGAE